MTNFPFNSEVPAANNNPSDDQPDMKINNQSNSSIWNEDHVGFAQANGGFHKKARFVNHTTIPTGRINNSGTLYTKRTAPLTESNLFYTPDQSLNEYQLTYPIEASFATFGQFSAYGTPASGFTQVGGWTFLPGGLLMQYGKYSKAGGLGSTGTIQFPVTWSSTIGYSVQLTLADSSAKYASVSSTLTTSFDFVLSNTSGVVFWTAIGPR